MSASQNRGTAPLRVTISGPCLQEEVEHLHAAGPLRIGSGYDNDLVLDETGVSERHCVIEVRPEGIVVSPLGGHLRTADGAVIRERERLPYGKPVEVGDTGLRLLLHRRGSFLFRFGSLLLQGRFGAMAFPATVPAKRLASALGAGLDRLSFGSKFVACVAIIVGAGCVTILASTPAPSKPAGEGEQLAAAVPGPPAGFAGDVGARAMGESKGEGLVDAEGRFSYKPDGYKRDGASVADSTKPAFRRPAAPSHGDQAILRAAGVALDGLGGEVAVARVNKGVVSLRGQLASKQDLEDIEEILIADVPGVLRIESSAVQLADRPVKLERDMLPDGIEAVWAGRDPYIEMDDGVRYWVGSVLRDGTRIVSITLDKITVLQGGTFQTFEIAISERATPAE